MGTNEGNPAKNQARLLSFFDEDELPWTSRLRWGLLLMWIAGILLLLAPLLGIYLGMWLLAKRRSILPLILYLLLSLLTVMVCFGPIPLRGAFEWIGDAALLSIFILWLASAFALRHQVVRYYEARERVPFRLNHVLTAIFGPWYVGGHLRAEFPLNNNGQTGEGVLKLVG